MNDSKTRRKNPESGEISRREILRQIALGLTAATGERLTLRAGTHIHQEVKKERTASGDYKPKLFTEQEFQTLCQLAELIIPADDVSGGGREAGAPEFIDLLCSQNQRLAAIFTGGLLWADSAMQKRHGTKFSAATMGQQTELLDALVQRERQELETQGKMKTLKDSSYNQEFSPNGLAAPTDLGAGVIFFGWIRRLVVDAYYTSEIGIKDLGYMGNSAMASYEVPQEVIELALKRSPLRASGNPK